MLKTAMSKPSSAALHAGIVSQSMKAVPALAGLAVAIGCSLLGGCAPAVDVQVASELSHGTARTVAVMPFEQGEPNPDHAETMWHESNVRDGGSLVSDMFTTELMRVPFFKVVERSQLKRVLAEQDLSMTELIARKSAQEIGQLLGVDAIVMGTVAELRQGNSFIPGNAWFHYSYSMRMVDTKTGLVLASTQVTSGGNGYLVLPECRKSVRAVVDQIIAKSAANRAPL